MEKLAFLSAFIGFWLGILFLLLLDHIIPHLHRSVNQAEGTKSRLSRTAMMVLAVTLHNIPEGMAVGVVYAGLLSGSANITAGGALALALGIATQNFPEGAIISMPLYAEGKSKPKSFLLGVFSGAVEPVFGALEVAQRQYDLRCEVEAYLKDHPYAAVVNLGCGMDDTFRKCDNGTCHGYNIDMPDVIKIRDELLPAGEREENIACDLNDYAWIDRIDASGGAVFFASGVFYYFKTEAVRKLFVTMADCFPGAVLIFDSCNSRGAKMMRKTWLKEAGITDVSAFFSFEDEKELTGWSESFTSVTAKSYMRGYRDIYNDVGLFHKLMLRFCDGFVKMKIVKIEFVG